MIKQFHQGSSLEISQSDNYSFQGSIEGSCEPPRASKSHIRGRLKLDINILTTRDLSLFQQVCNSPKLNLEVLNDYFANIPEEPTIDQNLELSKYALTAFKSKKSLAAETMTTFRNYSSHLNNSFYQPKKQQNFYEILYRDQHLKYFYLNSLINLFQSPKALYTDFQKLQLLHFQQTHSVIQIRNQFPLPPIKQIKEKLIYLPPQVGIKIKKTLILDLDETMVHCNENVDLQADFHLNIQISFGLSIRAGIKIRPHLLEFMQEMNKYFEIIVFTASQRIYAEAVLNKIDPDGLLIQFLFSRESCVQDKGHYIKDLRVVNGRDMSQIVIVDNSTMSFIYQLDNGIPIIPFYNDQQDTELLSLAGFLKTLIDVPDIRQTLKQYFQFQKLIDYSNPKEASDSLYQF